MADDEWLMAEGGLQVAEGELQMANEQCAVEAGGCDQRESSEPMAEGSFGPVVGHDSHGVVEESTNDKIGTLSHERTDVADGVCQGDGLEHGLACGVKTPQKAPSEAKLESTQSTSSQGAESRKAEPEGRERSQSAAAWLLAQGAGSDRVEPIAGGQERREGSGPQRSFAANGSFGHAGLLRTQKRGSE